MDDRTYYSRRAGRGPRANPTIEDIGRALTLAAREMQERDYLQEWYGYSCVDAGEVYGKAGVDLATHVETVLGRRDAWPLPEPLVEFLSDTRPSQFEVDEAIEGAEDLVFDLVEFFYDHVSAGTGGRFHDYSQCGWHYDTFDSAPAQQVFRARLNSVLHNYRTGYELTVSGEIVRATPAGMDSLLRADLRTADVDIRERVDAAIGRYRSRDRSSAEQRAAVRELFDVLEKLRPQVKEAMLRGDERDLFVIANNFTIRHLNEIQKGNYDGPLWLSWMFYVNLATIHLITRLNERRDAARYLA